MLNSTTGFEAIPTWPWSVVSGMRIYNADDGSSRDPKNYVVEGRKRDTDSWTLISEGNLDLVKERNLRPYTVINSTATSPDIALHHFAIPFSNSNIYLQYRVTFPETKNDKSSIMQVAEVELTGYFVTPDCSLTDEPSHSPSFQPTDAQPSSIPSSGPSQSPTHPLPTLSPTQAETPTHSVLDPNSVVTYIGGTNKKPNREYRAVDGTTSTFLIIKDEIDGTTGFTAIPTWPWSIVSGIRVYTATDGKARDPKYYVLEGRKVETDNWTLMSEGALNLSKERNSRTEIVINSTATSPDMTLQHVAIPFPNSEVYSQYKVTFNETRGESTIMQFVEVELPGKFVTDPDRTKSPSLGPSVSLAPITSFPTSAPTVSFSMTPSSNPSDTPSLKPSLKPSDTLSTQPSMLPSAIPSSKPSNKPSSVPSSKPSDTPSIQPSLSMIPSSKPSDRPSLIPSSKPSGTPSMAPTHTERTLTHSVLDPQSTIIYIGGTHNKPNREYRAVDGTTSTFVIFKDMLNSTTGFEAIPTWQWSVVSGIRVYTATDGSSRDPKNYLVEGRKRVTDSWTLISKGGLDLPKSRNSKEEEINSTATSPDMALHHSAIAFPNRKVYSQYRVTFPGTRNDKSNIMQFAEVELPGYFVTLPPTPEPTTTAPTTLLPTTTAPTTSAPTTTVPTTVPTVAPSTPPTEAATATPSDSFTDAPIVCSDKSPKQCKQFPDQCKYNKGKKKTSTCDPKRAKFDDDCTQYSKNKCKQYCDWSGGVCHHKCGTDIKKKCKKAVDDKGKKICSVVTVKNPDYKTCKQIPE